MSIYDYLNDKQQEACFTVDGPLLILAGAGSGKTSVLTHRVAYLISEAGVAPYNILAITFTNKAAGEMRERVDKLVGHGAEAIHVSTFHSMCVRILRRFAERLGYGNEFTIYDSDDQKALIKDVMKKLEIDTKQLKERTVMNEISSLKDELVSPEEYAITAMGDYKLRKISSCYTEYQAALRKNNAFDFDDLIMKTVELFKTCPDVLLTYQNRWQYIMVDEYQDTNTAQFELIRLLAGSRHNLCVVGDDDQSIYKFRGANIRNILDFERFYPEAKVVKLEQNYRSVQNILDAANSVIRNNAARKDKSLWSDKDKGELIHFRHFDTAFDEADFITASIAASVRKGESKYSENAILYRTNAQSRLIEERLVRDNVPYQVVGGVNFYSRREIKDLLAYLKTIDNARDDLCVKRIINIPKRGIGATTVAKLQAAADERGESLFSAICHPEWTDIKGGVADKLHGFEFMILRLRAIAETMPPSKVLKEVLDVTDYINQMDVETDEEAEERIDNIDELIGKVTSYEETAEEPTLSGLLEEIALVADVDSMVDDDERSLLMTIHSAKGLEFKNVYLVGMEDGLFPSYMSITEGNVEIEEERRLAYVAITRAKESLTITAAKARMLHGETQYNAVSRFVNEIPRALFDIAPVKTRSRDSYYDSDTSEYGGYRRYDSYRDDEDTYTGFKRNPSSDNRNFSGYSGSYGSGFSRQSEGGIYSSQDTYGGFSREPSGNAINSGSGSGILSSLSSIGVKKGADLQAHAVAATSDLHKGDRVHHIKFGDGTILNIVKEPRDSKVTVQFDTCGQKIMYASFAKLSKL